MLDASNVGSAIASRALSAALADGVRVTLAAAGASDVAAYMLVDRADRQLALRLIHAEFSTRSEAAAQLGRMVDR